MIHKLQIILNGRITNQDKITNEEILIPIERYKEITQKLLNSYDDTVDSVRQDVNDIIHLFLTGNGEKLALNRIKEKQLGNSEYLNTYYNFVHALYFKVINYLQNGKVNHKEEFIELMLSKINGRKDSELLFLKGQIIDTLSLFADDVNTDLSDLAGQLNYVFELINFFINNGSENVSLFYRFIDNLTELIDRLPIHQKHDQVIELVQSKIETYTTPYIAPPHNYFGQRVNKVDSNILPEVYKVMVAKGIIECSQNTFIQLFSGNGSYEPIIFLDKKAECYRFLIGLYQSPPFSAISRFILDRNGNPVNFKNATNKLIGLNELLSTD